MKMDILNAAATAAAIYMWGPSALWWTEAIDEKAVFYSGSDLYLWGPSQAKVPLKRHWSSNHAEI